LTVEAQMRIGVTVRFRDTVVHDAVVRALPGLRIGDGAACFAVPGLDLTLVRAGDTLEIGGRPLIADAPLEFTAGDAAVQVELLRDAPQRAGTTSSARLAVTMAALAMFAAWWETARTFAEDRPLLTTASAVLWRGDDTTPPAAPTADPPTVRVLSPVRFVGTVYGANAIDAPMEDSGLIVR
jgi:hypothetical protein